jgi:predicted MFS family arabinose efflux permease
MEKQKTDFTFTSYQKFVVLVLALTQFTVILDFMVMSPLGDMLMKSLSLKPAQFGVAVSGYAISAAVSGFITAAFADRFDRKRLLVFFYIGFIVGTVFCGLANSFPVLVAARIVTGIFGGVIGSVSMAIVTDLFSIDQRGRTMGFLQMGFGASQVLGIPISLFIADKLGWQSPFLMVAGLSAVIAILIIVKLKPITQHLALQNERKAFMHLWHTLTNKHYTMGFIATALLSLGGFMMMPFGSAFAVNNLKVAQDQLFVLFMVSGLCSLIVMPLIGKLSDKVDKFKIFVGASLWMMIMVVFYTNLSAIPLWQVIICNVLLMIGIMSRIVPSSAMVSSIPEMKDRGAFMSINSSLQQMAGGIGAIFAGTVVTKKDDFSPIEHYNTLGYIVLCISVVGIFSLYQVSKMMKRRKLQMQK